MKNQIKVLLTGLSICISFSSAAEPFRAKFINQTGEEHKGVVLMVWTKQGQRLMDGIRPVGGNETITFALPNCADYKEWRFIASLNYSDNPDNFDVVLVDTGKRPIEKCEYTITGRKGN